MQSLGKIQLKGTPAAPTPRQQAALRRMKAARLAEQIDLLPPDKREQMLRLVEILDARRRGYSHDEACALLDTSPEDLPSKPWPRRVGLFERACGL